MKIIPIAAYSKQTRAIGHGNDLIWKDLKGDLKRFRDVTRHHPVIMGRRTWDSLPENRRPLPNRTNIIITRDQEFTAPGALIAHSFEHALELAQGKEGADVLYVIGGGQIYEAALPYATHLDITEVDDPAEGDTHFPLFTGFREVSREPHEENGITYDFVLYERDPSATAS